MASSATKPIWVRQAEEAKIKSDAATAAAAKAAFEATFNPTSNPESTLLLKPECESDSEDSRPSSPAAVGPVDTRNCIVAGPGVAGGASGSPVSFTLTLKDSNGNKVPHGGAVVKAKILPGPGVGGPEIEAMVKDLNDGTYTITYLVPKRGNYNVHLSVSDSPVTGSPFPVFFSTGSATPAITAAAPTAMQVPMYGMINQTMPNMPNYMVGTGLGMMATGNSGGVILQGAGASLGEVCKEYLHGKCAKKAGECKFGHPPQALLMQVLATAATSMNGALMGPSAAAMAAAQAIVAAQALQAHHAAQMKDSSDPSGSPDKAAQAETLKRTIQISNLNPLLTTDQLKQLFGLCGAVTDCTITDSKHFAFVEFTKPESVLSALSLNNIDVGGRPLNVEMAKSLPVKSANSGNLPSMMQQAVALQQMQFQQALAMQQAAATQAAAARAATMKSATEAAAARAREISMKLKAEAGLPVGVMDGGVGEEKEKKKEEEEKKERSLSPMKRNSRSRSPVKYRSSRRRSRSRSKSYSPPIRSRRSRSPARSSRYSSSYRDRRERDEYGYRERRERERRDVERRDSERRERERERGERDSERREKDHHSSSSRRERERRDRERSRDTERSRSRERKYGKYEKDETNRVSRDEDERRNHDRVSGQKDPRPDKKEKVVEEERDEDSGQERETMPSSDSKSYKRKLDRDDYDKGHNDSRGEKIDKRKLDKRENRLEEERESEMGEARERETMHSSDSKSKKRKMDRGGDEYVDDYDYDKRQHRRPHRSEKSKEDYYRSEKSKEDYYHDKKPEKKNHRDASKTVLGSNSDRWMDEDLDD